MKVIRKCQYCGEPVQGRRLDHENCFRLRFDLFIDDESGRKAACRYLKEQSAKRKEHDQGVAEPNPKTARADADR